MNNWTFTERDAAIAAELQKQLPDALFDAHAHIYRLADARGHEDALWKGGPAEGSYAEWKRHVGRQVGEHRLRGGLFFPYPVLGCDMEASNQYLAGQLQPGSCGLMLVGPDYPRENALALLPKFAGFKPYHVFSKSKPTWNAPIQDYLPAWAWELADKHGLVIMLHMVRDAALADPVNQREIRAMLTKYPGAKLILAHSARGFHSRNTVNGIASLRGLENVWFDCSGICEPAATVAILREFGPRRLMWASDFPITDRRGKCVTIGDGFTWINPANIDTANPNSPALTTWPVGLESLNALLEACRQLGLNAADRQNIFHDNAARLLGLLKETGTKTLDLYRRGKKIMPGGAQLLSKRPEQFAPDQWPAYFSETRGCEVWDLDGRHYYDMAINGVGTALLGFNDPDVNAAVHRRIDLGHICSLNPADDIELADLFCEIHPWAEQIRFPRTGGEAMAVAARIARATTDRSVIAICGYHGWQDWYLAANLGDNDGLRGHLMPGLDPFGVPVELRGTVFAFQYNNREQFQKIIAEHGKNLAGVIMETCRYNDPAPGFLEMIRDETHKAGGLLIFDEVTIGWRLRFGGAHLNFGVNPDMAVFGKATANGFPMGAILGTRAAMEGANKSFISSSFWTEAMGPAAALATIRKMQRLNVSAHVARVGAKLQDIWRRQAAAHKLPLVVDEGYPCCARFHWEHPEVNELRTYFTQLMLERGFLAAGLVWPSFAHTDEIVAKYATATDESFALIAKALAAGNVKQQLKGPVAHTGFRRLL